MPSRPNQQRVALLDFDPVQFLSRVELLGIDRVARLQIVDFLDQRDVEQHAPCRDSVARYIDRAFACAKTPNLPRTEAVVHLAFPKDMTKRIKMGVGEA